MNSKEKEYIIIGIDGGGSKVSAGIIESKDISTFTIKSLSQQYYNERSEFNSDFSPVSMDIQLNEYNTEDYNVTNDEVLQGKAIIESFHNSIINLNIDKPILMGIGMVGLKTKDLRGIGAIANGPRIPNFCIQLEDALHKSNIHLHKPIQYIGSDADNCGIGEEYGKDGLFKDIQNGYYIGGGTGTADALKLKNELIPFDSISSWIAKSWEILNENNISMEQYTSLKGIQSIYSNYSEIPINELCNESIYANEIFSRALKNEQAALLTCADITKYMSTLIVERVETIFSGWQNKFGLLNPKHSLLINNHPYKNNLLERIIIGQGLGKLFHLSKNTPLLWDPLHNNIYDMIQKSRVLPSEAKKFLFENGTLKKGFIMTSNLDNSALLGAGVTAIYS
jgi:hypothetical protein|tara:strand:+ start:1072 stop:2256 length:1185 start_codon:yes stop_codon:yes gene_type:complete